MSIRDETILAYSDANELIPDGERNLRFLASDSVSRDEAYEIMKVAVPNGYNNFHAELINLLPADAKIMLAREWSPCIYVLGRIDEPADLECDEFYYEPESDLTRIWWD